MVDFGKYMKLWRFKEIKHFVPQLMEDKDLKEEGDDWWKFKTFVNKIAENRKEHFSASHVLVFDESMSAFIPRLYQLPFINFCYDIFY